jgi:hypothetical protein
MSNYKILVFGFFICCVLVACSQSRAPQPGQSNTTPPAANVENPPVDLSEYSPEVLKDEMKRRNEAVEKEFISTVEISPDTTLFNESRVMKPAGAQNANIEVAEALKEVGTMTITEAVYQQEKSIYGGDNRKDLCDVEMIKNKVINKARREKILRLARSVVGFLRNDQVLDKGDGTSLIKTEPMRKRHKVCEEESFSSQPTAMWCSGVLVAPSIIATAAHCLNEVPLAEIRFVFGWAAFQKGSFKTTIRNNEIYKGKNIVDMVHTKDAADWALINLDRPVQGITPVKYRNQNRINNFEDVYIIGHGCGLPLKYADGAKVRKNTDDAFFVTNLDAFGGNSGSPVFNYNDDTLEGILSRGEPDFDLQPIGCYKSHICPMDGCLGESCTRTTIFSALIK